MQIDVVMVVSAEVVKHTASNRRAAGYARISTKEAHMTVKLEYKPKRSDKLT